MTTATSTTPGDLPEEIGTAQSSRWERILALLADQERLSVTEAATELGVSESTIRRDFDQMAQAQLAHRTHGGIVAGSLSYGLPSRYAHPDPRMRAIAHTAVHLLTHDSSAGLTVGINGGTTTTAVAEELGRMVEAPRKVTGEQGRVTVVSSALNIANSLVLRPQIRIVSLGGVVRSNSYELTGPLAIEAMSSLWLDFMVLGFVGLDTLSGITCSDADEAAVTRTMVEHSGKVIAVGTSDKIGTRAFSRICGLRDIDVLVTDSAITAEQIALVKASKTELVLS